MDSGYGDWFKSEEDINKDEAKNVSEFGEIFERKKKNRQCIEIKKAKNKGKKILNFFPLFYYALI